MDVEHCIEKFKNSTQDFRFTSCLGGRVGNWCFTYGDSANFAEALKRIYGGDIMCSYENEDSYIDGEPNHCAIYIGEGLYDITGKIDELQLMEYCEDCSNVIIEEADESHGYQTVRNRGVISSFENILRKRGCGKGG